MRKIPALLATTALAAIALVGCAPAAGTANSFGCTPSAEPGAATSLVKVSGDLGQVTGVKVPTPLNVKQLERAVPVTGDGAQVVSQDQFIKGTVSAVSTATGAGGALTKGVQLLTPSSIESLATGAGGAILCARQGDRVVVAVPAAKISPDFVNQIGVTKTTGMVLVVDLDSVLPSKAEGTAVFNARNGLPSVVRAADGQPGVVVPSSAAPKDVITETLIEGHGEKVDGKQSMAYLQYTSVDWETRKVSQSTWSDHKPFASPLAAAPEAVQKAVEGKTVGSQVMTVVPSATDNEGRPTVYVIDILGVEK